MQKITIFRIARKSITRKLFRSAAIAFAVAVVAATLFSVTTVMGSVESSLRKGTARLGADVMVVPAEAEALAKTTLLAGEPSTFYMDRAIEEKVRATRGVKAASSQTFLQTAEYGCCSVADMLLIGFDPEHDFTIIPWLEKRLDKPLTREDVIMGKSITAYDVFNEVTLYGTDFNVAALIDRTGMKFIDESIFLPYAALRRVVDESKKEGVAPVDLPLDKISTVLVQVEPEYSPQRVAIFIEHDIDGVKAIISEEVISSVRKQLFMLLRSILTISGILWGMSLLFISVVFSMIVNERQREIGLLRAMGAKRSNIFRLIITEAYILSTLGGVAGIAAGGVFLFGFKGFIRSSFNIPYLWPSPGYFVVLIAMCLVISVLTGSLAALLPALRSMRMEAYSAIRRGE